MKEWIIGYKDENGEIHISGLAKPYSSLEQAEYWFGWVIGPWRKEMEEAAANEDVNRTNWAAMTLAEKKKEIPVLLSREVTPYTIEKEGPPWD